MPYQVLAVVAFISALLPFSGAPANETSRAKTHLPAARITLTQTCGSDGSGCLFFNGRFLHGLSQLGKADVFKSDAIVTHLKSIKKWYADNGKVSEFDGLVEIWAEAGVPFLTLKKVLNSCAAAAFFKLRYFAEQGGSWAPLDGLADGMEPLDDDAKVIVLDVLSSGFETKIAPARIGKGGRVALEGGATIGKVASAYDVAKLSSFLKDARKTGITSTTIYIRCDDNIPYKALVGAISTVVTEGFTRPKVASISLGAEAPKPVSTDWKKRYGGGETD